MLSEKQPEKSLKDLLENGTMHVGCPKISIKDEFMRTFYPSLLKSTEYGTEKSDNNRPVNYL